MITDHLDHSPNIKLNTHTNNDHAKDDNSYTWSKSRLLLCFFEEFYQKGLAKDNHLGLLGDSETAKRNIRTDPR